MIFFPQDDDQRAVRLPWLGAGLFFGLALASKYIVILLLPGLMLFLLSSGLYRRRWLVRPQVRRFKFLQAAPKSRDRRMNLDRTIRRL
jgi:4-amino-4-deoxy-L-arabinose transferase-like glycosyltransferase